VIFSDAGPDIRWVGNESGEAGETNWDTLHRDQFRPGGPNYALLTEGQEDGPDWLPSECDVSIRPGWFWKESENAEVKSVKDLVDIYYKSVGRGSSMLLNVPPDKDGVFNQADVLRLAEFHQALVNEFAHPLRPRNVEASSISGPGFEAARATDGREQTYWATPVDTRAATLTLDFGSPMTFDRVMLQEPIAQGQRIKMFEVQIEQSGEWTTVAKGTTIGHKRLLRIPPATAQKVRIAITDARAAPALSEVRCFNTAG
jgi:alpha-L-fucosidase